LTAHDTEEVGRRCRLSLLLLLLLFYLHNPFLRLEHGERHLTLKVNGTVDSSLNAALLLLRLLDAVAVADFLRLRANTAVT